MQEAVSEILKICMKNEQEQFVCYGLHPPIFIFPYLVEKLQNSNFFKLKTFLQSDSENKLDFYKSCSREEGEWENGIKKHHAPL